jgi:AcrR family transcriptional regulator
MSVTVIQYPRIMSRWEPDARGRLQQAAVELYVERGFEQTTVAEIAQRAGLTERTFFRHFTDKREVLFWGSSALQELFVSTVVGLPVDTTPLDAVSAAVEAASGVLEERSEWSRQRFAAISANPALQEREVAKMATLTTAVAAALRTRGVGEPAASLTAGVGIAVFKVAFESWVDPDNQRGFGDLVRDSFAELRVVTAGS